MKSRDIAIAGILLAIGAIVRYLSLIIPGPIVANLVIAFYCLAVILILPTVTEALGIGLVAGIISALISHSIFPPGNLISEPIGALVCLGLYRVLKSRPSFGPGLTTFLATLASGFSFVIISLVVMAPKILSTYATLGAYVLVIIPIVTLAALANAVIVQILYFPAARIVLRDRA
ncbi:hypothetical protein [Methanosphaerula subterraneus]|jgi:hypothetical protein|uniref:hypothetical protein n=1 Tax=Methanosphaerula subterraneus TaxID=3350244 RepID=UPI003F840916